MQTVDALTLDSYNLNHKNISTHTQAVPDLKTHNTNINAYYDSPAVQFFEQITQQQIHLAYWDDKYPWVSMAQAAKRLTQVIIDQLDISKDACLLDIGCGCGVPAIDIAKQKGCRVEGITINPQQKSKAEISASESHVSDQVSFCVGDASELPYADQQFESALLLESIHHIGHREALSEAWRVLKPGGSILIADGVVLKEKVNIADKTILADTFVAKSLLTESEIYRALTLAGFRNIETIDLSNAVKPTWNKLIEVTKQKKMDIIKEHGIDFYQTMVDFWMQMNSVWTHNANYLIFKGKK